MYGTWRPKHSFYRGRVRATPNSPAPLASLLRKSSHRQTATPTPRRPRSDLGYNDISFHGSPQIPTPHIDAIFSGGTALSRYYAQPVCSPTRASILSGRHVIHTGIYMPLDSGVTNEALDASYTLLPRYLKRAANYSCHAVGKWHLGANALNATPTGRGFDSHLGYWSGAEDYTAHTVGVTVGPSKNHMVYDFQDGLTPRVDLNGSWSTEVLASRAVGVIAAQAALGAGAPPLFLYLAFQNVHWPLEAPADIVARFANATGGNEGRQKVCAMAAFLDAAVGNVTAALATLLPNTIVAFVSDNGGPTHGNEGTWSNNFPLRGGKNTLWEGGTRVLGAVKGPGVPAGAALHRPVHATDWLPSLVSLATGGADFRQFAPPGEPPYEAGDGVDVWATIASAGAAPAQRDWVLLETHANASYLTHGDGLIVGDMKLLEVGPRAPPEEDGWWPPDGQNANTTNYTLACDWGGSGRPRAGGAGATPKRPSCGYPRACLFNISADPCEYHDLSAELPGVVQQLRARLTTYRSVPPLVGRGCFPRLITGPASQGGEAFAFQPCDAPS